MNVINDERKKRYSALTTKISRWRQKGLDVSELIALRNELEITDHSPFFPREKVKNIVSNSFSNNQQIIDLLNGLPFSTILQELQAIKSNQELLQENFLSLQSKLLNELENIKIPSNKREILSTSIIKPKPEIISTSKPKPIVSKPKPETEDSLSLEEKKDKDIALFIERKLLLQIKEFCTENKQQFKDVNVFIRNAFSLKDQLDLDKESYLTVTKLADSSTKKHLLLSPELQLVYYSLIHKIIETNQILSAYLEKNR